MKKQKGIRLSNIIKEFSRFANQYDQYNIIQKKVAKTLVKKLPFVKYKNILDIGCGSGTIFKNLKKEGIYFDKLTVLDSSQNMLNIHPKTNKIEKIYGDFNTQDFMKSLHLEEYDILLSSSSLQWSKDLDFTFNSLSALSKKAYLAIFTSDTFKTLHKIAKVDSPIYSSKEIEKSISKYYEDVNFELHTYTLYFDTVRKMFQYIKKSGVSTGEKKLSYKEMKILMQSYPLDYLEFEVLFIEAKKH